LAADPQGRDKAIEKEFEKASRDALELLRRDADKARPDWVVVATANAGRWDFTLIYTRGKGLAHPSANKNNPAEGTAIPPLTDLVLPRNGSVELNVTSNDGIQALEVPGLGITANALPGRIERALIDTTKPGVFSSTCAEPCSAQAKNSTLTIHIVDSVTFLHWKVAREAASTNTQKQ
jgi:heme/copper-type cytochrome/quinol oxidase subunit 2